MGTVSLVFQVIMWTLGVAVGAVALVFSYLALRRGRRKVTRPAGYLALLALGFIGIAVAMAVDGLRPTVFFLAMAMIGIGTLGGILATRYGTLRRIRWYALVVVALGGVGTLWVVGPVFWTGDVRAGIPRPDSLTERAVVARVIDGDTILVTLQGRQYRVRYIGMDTPETVHPSLPVQCYGKEASEFNRRLVEGKSVYLERDISQVDRYGRLLRYVWLEDEMVNGILVREGYAQVATFPPDVKYVQELLELQQRARQERAGLWGKC